MIDSQFSPPSREGSTDLDSCTAAVERALPIVTRETRRAAAQENLERPYTRQNGNK